MAANPYSLTSGAPSALDNYNPAQAAQTAFSNGGGTSGGIIQNQLTPTNSVAQGTGTTQAMTANLAQQQAAIDATPARAQAQSVANAPATAPAPSPTNSSASSATGATPIGDTPPTTTQTAGSTYNPYDVKAPTTDASGIVGTQMKAPDVQANPYTAAQGTAQNANLTNWNVNANQTVQGQLNNILASNSPLMQRAQTEALQEMNSRGLVNSSMAEGAAQAAMMDKAMPIAQADASTYGQSAQFNANAANTNSQFNTGQQNAMTSQNVTAQNDASKANQANSLASQVANQDAAVKQSAAALDSATKVALDNADNASKLQLTQIDSAVKTTITQMEGQYKNQLQTSQSMSDTFRQMMDNITRIMQDTNLDGPSKQIAIDNITRTASNNLLMLKDVTAINVGPLLDFSDAGVAGYKNTTTNAPSPQGGVVPSSGGSPFIGGVTNSSGQYQAAQ